MCSLCNIYYHYIPANNVASKNIPGTIIVGLQEHSLKVCLLASCLTFALHVMWEPLTFGEPLENIPLRF